MGVRELRVARLCQSPYLIGPSNTIGHIVRRNKSVLFKQFQMFANSGKGNFKPACQG